MPILDLREFAAAIETTERPLVAGLDVGSKTIGLAVSDADWRFAHPRPVVARRKFAQDFEALMGTVEREGVGGLVVGLPLNMDGSTSPRAQAARAFARNVLQRRDMPVLMWDERLSTVAAERALLEMDVSRAKRSTRIDSAAAAFILQGALDALVGGAGVDADR